MDSRDRMLQSRLKIWRRERIGEPWMRLGRTDNDQSLEECHVEIFGFTHYAIAY